MLLSAVYQPTRATNGARLRGDASPVGTTRRGVAGRPAPDAATRVRQPTAQRRIGDRLTIEGNSRRASMHYRHVVALILSVPFSDVHGCRLLLRTSNTDQCFQSQTITFTGLPPQAVNPQLNQTIMTKSYMEEIATHSVKKK